MKTEKEDRVIFKYSRDEWSYHIEYIREEIIGCSNLEKEIYIDLEDVDSLCSLSISRLLSIKSHYNSENRKLVIINMSDRLKNLLRRLQIYSFFFETEYN